MPGAGAYLRVSTEDQGENYSLGNQREALTLLAARHGLPIVQWYEDSKSYRGDDGKIVEPSARRADRPAWRHLLADVGAGRISAILALDHTRLAGDYQPMTDLIETVERARARVLLVSETFDTELSIFHSWARRQWYRQNTARSHAGRRSRTAQGLHPGRAPLFYRVLRNEKGKSIGYELIEEYRPWLDRLAQMFLAGESFSGIADVLDRNPATGRHIDSAGVKLILNNAWLRGRVEFGQQPGVPRVVAQGRHSAVWDAATCAAIESELARRRMSGKSRTHHGKFLFSGIVRCGVCGYILTGQTRVSRGIRYVNYTCSHGGRIRRGRADGIQHRTNINEIKLLRLVREVFASITPAEVDELIPRLRLTRPGSAPAPDATEFADLERQAQELRADLDAVSSTAARRAIAADLERVERHLAALRAVVGQGGEPPVDLQRLRAALLEMIANPDWLAWPPAAGLHEILARALPALYVAGGTLSPPPA